MSKRPTCPSCLRPEKTCLCKFCKPVLNQIPVVILQHPDEVNHAKNTGRLLHLSLTRTQILVGEAVDCTELLKSIDEQTGRNYFDVLLYPNTTDYLSLGLKPPPIFDWQNCNYDEFLSNHSPRLWVIDGTWRKSRKMLYLNQFLQSMPLMELNVNQPSQYFIRKSTQKNQLSTFEATCYALQQLEANAVDYEPALSALANFIDEQAQYFGFK